MYAVAISLVGYLLYREGITLIWMWCFIAYIITWALFPIMDKYRILVVLCVGLGGATFWALPLWLTGTILPIFAVALYLRLVWEPKITNIDPVLEDRLHAIWHFLTALGFSLFFI